MNIVPISRAGDGRRKIAVVGSGIAGASAAWALSSVAEVTLFEADARAGGHTATIDIDYLGRPISVDIGFIVYNELNYPDLTSMFAHLGVKTHPSKMSFSLSLDDGKVEWSSRDLDSVFAQRGNMLSPTFLRMVGDILRFNRLCVRDRDAGRLAGRTIGAYLKERGFSASFRDNYLIPMAAAIWSTPRISMLDYPAAAFVTFFENHRLIHQNQPLWRTVTGGSRNYLERLLEPLGARNIRLASPVETVIRDALGVTVWAAGGEPERFDEIVIASHSDQALAMLGDASALERSILSAMPYRENRVVLHRDPGLMPKRRKVWSAWNYLRSSRADDESEVSLTYSMNELQGIDDETPLFVSLNPAVEPRAGTAFGEWSFAHPQFDAAGLSAQSRLGEIQGVRRTWFAGAWTGYGFHEDGARSGLDVAAALGATVPWRRGKRAEAGEPVAEAAE